MPPSQGCAAWHRGHGGLGRGRDQGARTGHRQLLHNGHVAIVVCRPAADTLLLSSTLAIGSVEAGRDGGRVGPPGGRRVAWPSSSLPRTGSVGKEVSRGARSASSRVLGP